MNRLHCSSYPWSGLAGLLILATAAGCDTSPPSYRANLVFAGSQKLFEDVNHIELATARQMEDIEDLVVAYFGTPDDPHVPKIPDVDLSNLLDENKLTMAAGAVGSDETGRPRGLYREHCAHCHGITGDGAGPTAAFLNPYPRDYRPGTFKFTSTPIGTPPTHQDLAQILNEGVAGTAMPSFRLLPEDQREALVQYVRYLSMRGQFERELIYEAANELEVGERMADIALADADPAAFSVQLDRARSLATTVAEKWLEAEGAVTEIPAPPADWNTPASVAAGKRLFFSSVSSCAACHGDAALGDGRTTEYDNWTKEILAALGDSGPSASRLASFQTLEPRFALPRNLRQGVYRGGRRPIDLYWRIKNGIDGTPMPSASAEMSSDDVWHLIDYVRQLPYESISQKGTHDPPFHRERM